MGQTDWTGEEEGPARAGRREEPPAWRGLRALGKRHGPWEGPPEGRSACGGGGRLASWVRRRPCVPRVRGRGAAGLTACLPSQSRTTVSPGTTSCTRRTAKAAPTCWWSTPPPGASAARWTCSWPRPSSSRYPWPPGRDVRAQPTRHRPAVALCSWPLRLGDIATCQPAFARAAFCAAVIPAPSPRSRGGFSSVRQQFCPAGLGVSSSVLAEGRAFAGSFPGRAAFPDVPCLERLAVWHWQQLRPRWLLSQSDLLLLSKAWGRERGEGPGPYAPAVPELRPLPFLMEAAAWRGAGRVRTDGVGPGHPQTPRTPEPDVSQRPAPAAPGSVAFSLDRACLMSSSWVPLHESGLNEAHTLAKSSSAVASGRGPGGPRDPGPPRCAPTWASDASPAQADCVSSGRGACGR